VKREFMPKGYCFAISSGKYWGSSFHQSNIPILPNTSGLNYFGL